MWLVLTLNLSSKQIFNQIKVFLFGSGHESLASNEHCDLYM